MRAGKRKSGYRVFREKAFIASLVLCIVSSGLAQAQPHTVSVERLLLPSGQSWSNAHFASDGKAIFLSGTGYGSIWKYDLTSRAITRVVAASGVGYGFALSSDNRSLAYRSTTTDPVSHRRFHSARILDLATGKSSIVASGRDIGIPVFAGGRAVTLENGAIASSGAGPTSAEPEVLGIENTKIVLLEGGRKVVLDPFGNGSYIWPSLSPDKTKLVAYELGHGTFV
ncbi:MAG: hypothetical protein WB699_03435, partial [Bacteroidota bacterium]